MGTRILVPISIINFQFLGHKEIWHTHTHTSFQSAVNLQHFTCKEPDIVFAGWCFKAMNRQDFIISCTSICYLCLRVILLLSFSRTIIQFSCLQMLPLVELKLPALPFGSRGSVSHHQSLLVAWHLCVKSSSSEKAIWQIEIFIPVKQIKHLIKHSLFF